MDSAYFLTGLGFSAHWMPRLPSVRITGISLSSLPTGSCDELLAALAARMEPGSHLIGWSLGGLLALYLCQQHPHRYRSLTLLASTPYFMDAPGWPGITTAQFEGFEERFIPLVSYPTASMGKNIASHHIPIDKGAKALIPLLDAREWYGTIRVPLLHLWGAKDAIVPVRQSRLLASHHRHHQLEDAGHALWHTHPQLALPLIQEHWAQC